jgi:hypothetical protein
MAGTQHDPTAQPHEPAQAGQPGQAVPWHDADNTQTITTAGGPAYFPPRAESPSPGSVSAGNSTGNAGGEQVIRYGPGVPVPGSVSRAGPTAEQVWRTGLPDEPRRPGRVRRLAGPTLSVALLVASGVVIFLRLHHGPLGVTGVAITAQVKHGCREDVTARVGTTGGAGTVSYQWVFQPQVTAPRPLSQSVASGQSAVYVTASVAGQGHGSLAQTVTLQVLGPGHGSASAHVALSC